MFRLGYNTNGLAHHRVVDALRLVAELGYEGLAITPDVGQLDPFAVSDREVAEVRAAADDLGLELSVETGARYLLDPRKKHFPTLLEERARDRARRIDFLCRAVDLAAGLGAGTMSFWAGGAPESAAADASGAVGEGGAHEALWERLAAGCESVLEHARGTGVRVAFEPEPGMFLERPAGYVELRRRLGERGADLGLCLDVGHCLCTNDLPVGDVIRAHAADLAMVHLDDIAGGLHEHRMFGEGDLDLPETLNALLEVGYAGLAAVELSRDSHRGPAAAREALQHLRRALGS